MLKKIAIIIFKTVKHDGCFIVQTNNNITISVFSILTSLLIKVVLQIQHFVELSKNLSSLPFITSSLSNCIFIARLQYLLSLTISMINLLTTSWPKYYLKHLLNDYKHVIIYNQNCIKMILIFICIIIIWVLISVISW